MPLVRAVHFDLAADLGCYRLKVVLHGMVDNVDPVLDVCYLVATYFGVEEAQVVLHGAALVVAY